MFSVCLALFCSLSIYLALQKDKNKELSNNDQEIR